MAFAKFTWTPAGGSLQEYTCAVNYSYASKPGLADVSDRGRAIDGTLRTYAHPLKKSWMLAFRNISTAQKDQLLTIKQTQVDIDFYADGSTKTCTAQWTNAFNFVEAAPGVWNGTIQLEEV